MSRAWWKDSVVYQIYPRSFMDSNGDGIGDIPGIISKLDYLNELGVEVVWLSPVYESPNDDNGYDISNYRKIMDEFGTMADWEELLAQMHSRDMKLIMDLVVNHSSDEHAWFVESKKAKDNPYRDYYIWRPGKEGQEPTNWASNFGGSAWKYDEQTGEYFLHLFSPKQPDLNWENPQLREEVYDMMTWWLDKGIDGFRMDVINFISKSSYEDVETPAGKRYGSGSEFYRNGPRIHEFLHEMNQKVLSKYDAMTVGEMPSVTPEWAREYTDPERKELNMVFQFEHMGLDNGSGGKWDLKPLELADLKENLSKWQYALEDVGWNSLYFNNHDQPRAVSRFGNDGPYRKESAKMLATLLHMMKGTPFIYQGEELGMTNVQFDSIDDYRDIEILNFYREHIEEGGAPEDAMVSIYAKGRDNARTPMQWDDSKNAGFSTGEPWINMNPNFKEINAQEALADENSIFYYYKKLIALRKQYDIIVEGSYQLILDDHPEIFAYTRKYNDATLLVVNNFYKNEPTFTVPEELNGKSNELLVSNYSVKEKLNDSVKLRPYETRVYLY